MFFFFFADYTRTTGNPLPREYTRTGVGLTGQPSQRVQQLTANDEGGEEKKIDACDVTETDQFRQPPTKPGGRSRNVLRRLGLRKRG